MLSMELTSEFAFFNQMVANLDQVIPALFGVIGFEVNDLIIKITISPLTLITLHFAGK